MDESKVVITGSTRGLGLAMAREFASRGCPVMVSGRSPEATETARARLQAEYPESRIAGRHCDIRRESELQGLWDAAVEAFGAVDHWINNAGIPQSTRTIWELGLDELRDLIDTDLLGAIQGARVAMRGMQRQGSGAIWFMEGHGSNGRIMRGLSVYGASKRGVRYVARALAVEAEVTPVRIGALSPGIMITDFTMDHVDRASPAWERTKRIFNILADRPERVAAFLVPRILGNTRNGSLIAWLTPAKILFRFMTSALVRRSVVD
ncbi:MAG TPA: SDR family oxidoreductase [Rectinemataceae bacterium]|nr:SDR family oxidoreductase [Rectinemataceae bacterium]